MKIRVSGVGVPPIRLYIPNGLLLNSAVASVISFAAVQKGVFLTTAQILEWFCGIKAYVRNNPEWVLVDVQTHNGVSVYIKL